jgi:gamma-glutamylcyclotransferase (GGCT)/AIG2-like uncharacterized protein YtfP
MSRLPIFVYGTLRWQCGNDRLWHGRAVSHHDGRAYVIGYALADHGFFPYLVAASSAQTVGALIVPADEHYDDVLADMDHLEGYEPGRRYNHYERIIVVVFTPDGQYRRAWTYLPEMDDRIARLPDVPTNADGRYDWRCSEQARRTTTRIITTTRGTS